MGGTHSSTLLQVHGKRESVLASMSALKPVEHILGNHTAEEMYMCNIPATGPTSVLPISIQGPKGLEKQVLAETEYVANSGALLH